MSRDVQIGWTDPKSKVRDRPRAVRGGARGARGIEERCSCLASDGHFGEELVLQQLEQESPNELPVVGDMWRHRVRDALMLIGLIVTLVLLFSALSSLASGGSAAVQGQAPSPPSSMQQVSLKHHLHKQHQHANKAQATQTGPELISDAVICQRLGKSPGCFRPLWPPAPPPPRSPPSPGPPSPSSPPPPWPPPPPPPPSPTPRPPAPPGAPPRWPPFARPTLAALNARFRDGHPSNDLAEAGVVIHRKLFTGVTTGAPATH